MFLHQLAKQTTIQQYAPAQHRHYFALWRLRHALNWLSFALIVIAALWALQEGLLRKDPDESSIQKSQQQTAEIQRKAQQILRQQPKTDVAPSDLRAVVLSIRTLRKHAVAPQEFLAPLAHVMDRYPAIQLDELAWEISSDAAHPDLVGEIPPTIKLKAHLAAPPENDHFTLDYLEKYERELKNNGYEILSLSRPFDWMTATSGQIDGAQVAHDYTLKLQWKITP
jgi:hypothetical protein